MENKIVSFEYSHDHIFKYIELDFIDSHGNLHPVIPADYTVEIPEEDCKKLIKYLSQAIRNDTKIFSIWDSADHVMTDSEFPDKIFVERSEAALIPRRKIPYLYENFFENE